MGYCLVTALDWERSGSVVECLTRDREARGFEPHRRHCVMSLSKNINPSLVLVQPRKTCPYITERLLKGRKESNQTNQTALDWLTSVQVIKYLELKILNSFLSISFNVCCGCPLYPQQSFCFQLHTLIWMHG